MIRFVDIRGNNTGYRFSFWDTVLDTYIKVNGDQAWSTWEEFEKVVTEYNTDCFIYQWSVDPISIDRFKGLCPEWAFEDEYELKTS